MGQLSMKKSKPSGSEPNQGLGMGKYMVQTKQAKYQEPKFQRLLATKIGMAWSRDKMGCTVL